MLVAGVAGLITDKQQVLQQEVVVLVVILQQVLTALLQLQIRAEVVAVLELLDQETLELVVLAEKV
jgi:hypothetical protein